jgi:hypothetical protein
VIIPVSFSGVFLDACWGLFFAGIGLSLLGEARKISRRGLRSYNPIGLATIAAYFAVHAYGFLSVSHYQRGFFAVTIYHGMQYLALLWLLEKEVSSRSQTAGQSSFSGVASALAAISQRAGLFVRRFPFLFFWGFIFAASLGWERYLSVRANTIWPMFSLVMLSAVSAHHYVVDTVLWRTSAGK